MSFPDPQTTPLPEDDALAALLAEWLGQQRWFAGRAGEPVAVRLEARGRLTGIDRVEFVLVDATHGGGYRALPGPRRLDRRVARTGSPTR